MKVRVNNNSAFITGYAAVSESSASQSTSIGIDGTNTVNYKNPSSQVGSTTGNYTGVYDMSGGVKEYVMGVVRASATSYKPLYLNSGFTDSTIPNNSKYYDLYKYGTSSTDFAIGILGDGTKETKGWFSGTAYVAYASQSWFQRGGSAADGLSSGLFNVHNNPGQKMAYYGFRIILAI